MRLLHYLTIENFKGFGDRQRIELDHPAVLIGPNNCGKTTTIQAIALWSQAIKTWFQSKGETTPKQRTATALNRLNIVSVPVQRTRYFWHNTVVRRAQKPIQFKITLGVLHAHRVEPVTMLFRNQGEDLVYCTPDPETLQNPDLIATAAHIDVELLYPMSGLETEEPILQPGRIDVLLGQGLTAQVLRNLCLTVRKEDAGNWAQIVALMQRLFAVDLDEPVETTRGSIDLYYRQSGIKEPLDVALAGRGLQQMLLVLAYLYSHRRSVLLIDEPDAHLELLRQKQVYVLLREIASRNESQVILATHSEAILAEAVARNLTLLLRGQAENLATRKIRQALRYYGAEHYIRARQRGYVLYVEGSTDLDILQALATRLGHAITAVWDERINTYYVQDNYPNKELDSNLERAEEGFGLTAQRHFSALQPLIPHLRGLAILDSNGQSRQARKEGNLEIAYWSRYEAENYFVTPGILKSFALDAYSDTPLFQPRIEEIENVLHALILKRVFHDQVSDFQTWQNLDSDGARLLWAASTERIKLSDFAEEFFRQLAETLGFPMLLRKGELHQLVDYMEPQTIPAEVAEKLDLIQELFEAALS